MVKASINLTAEKLRALNKLLVGWARVFSRSDTDLGCTNIVQHRINMTDETPIKQRHHRIPQAMYEEARNHLKSMLDSGVIRESESPWASPIGDCAQEGQ